MCLALKLGSFHNRIKIKTYIDIQQVQSKAVKLSTETMSIVTSLLSYLFSFWPVFAVILIIVLSTFLLFKKNNKTQDDWSEGIAEIKPGVIWGNDIPEETGFMKQYDTVYKAMKGLRYCLYYNGGTLTRGVKKLLILDPDLVEKVTKTDFDHFVDNQFFTQGYMEVKYLLI